MMNKVLKTIENTTNLCFIASIIVFFANLPRIIESLYNIFDRFLEKYLGKTYARLNFLICVLEILKSVNKKKQRMIKNNCIHVRNLRF